MGKDGEALRSGLHVFSLLEDCLQNIFCEQEKPRALDCRSELSRNREWKQIYRFYHEDLLAVKHIGDVEPSWFPQLSHRIKD